MKKDPNRNHDQKDCDFSPLNPDIFVATDRNSLKEDLYGNYQYESPEIENHGVYGYDRSENISKEQVVDEKDYKDEPIDDDEDDLSDDFNSPADSEDNDDDSE